MSFYVTLPSNASPNIFADNKPGHFFVKLPQTLDLTSQYEVGLAEVQFPPRYFNALQGDVWFRYFLPPKPSEECKPPITLNLPPGHYHTAEVFIDALNLLIDQAPDVASHIRFSFDKTTSRAALRLFQPKAKVQVSAALKYILGFTEDTASDTFSFLVGTIEVDVDITSKNVYVYCDIVAPRVVGDAMVPLLRTVPILNREEASVFRMYDKPHYIPLSRFSFDTLEILLTNELGQTIPFASGTSVLTLHFRQRRNLEL